MQISFFHFLREQLATVPPVEHEDLSGKTVVVIGANVGLGFEAAKHFAKMNPDRIILGCRSKERGEAAATSETDSQSYHSVSHYTYKGLKAETGYESSDYQGYKPILLKSLAFKFSTETKSLMTCFNYNILGQKKL